MAASLFLGGLAFLLAVVWGAPLIRFLRAQRIGKQIRIEGPQTHQVKAGTPTMGGLMIVVPVVVISGMVALINLIVELNQGRPIANIGQQILVPVGTMVVFAILGAIDDWENVRGKRVKGEGMSARSKMMFQVLIATIVALVLHFGPSQLRSVAIPGVIEKIDIGLLWIPIAVFWIVGFSNAVNFTDGLDGLAGIIAATAFMAYAIIAYLQSFAGAQPGVQPPVSSLVPFSLIVVGAILAFLWFNAHPAQLFMGDTGSLAMGGAIAVIAIILKQEFLLIIAGGMFVLENVSVVMQRTYFKYTKKRYGEGKRIFLMAPIHHHFEKKGWKETQVVVRFWILAGLCALLSLATLKIR